MGGVLVVTGGGRGIGAATARLAGERGYKVCVNYRSRADRAQEVVEHIQQAGGTAIAVQADVSTDEGATALFKEADAGLGTVTALFNNAGTILQQGLVSECTADQLDWLWRTNVTSQFLCAREAVKRMSTKHGGSGGTIVNMSSVHSRIGAPGAFVSYAASKGAIDTFTQGLALEVVDQGIRVNAVRPGVIDTEIHALGGDPDRPKNIGPSLPMGRAGTPEEVAQAVLWLLSDEASYVVNAVVDIGGGR